MKTAFHYFTRNLSVETLKTKHTLVWWLMLAAPLFVVFLSFNIFYFKGHLIIKPGDNPWIRFSLNSIYPWVFLFFPLYISLQAALVNAIEHQANTWKYVYTLAVPKWSIFFSKLTLFTGMVIGSMVALYAFTKGAGWLLGIWRPTLGFQHYTLTLPLLATYTKICLAAFGVTAIQFYISFRFRNFIFPAGFGVFMTITSFMLMQWEHVGKFPYAWINMVTQGATLEKVTWVNEYVIASVITYAVVAAIGYIETSFRNVNG